jgi:hypothetical protein
MPNHVTNKVYIENGDIMQILAIVASEGSEFDFNKIIPMPESLSGTTSCSSSTDDDKKRHAENILMYGHADWYSWSIENWGTKWNAYSVWVDEDDECITFDTAWSTPHPIFAALSRLLPDATIIVKFADEDIGYNCGVLAYRNGVEDFIDMAGRDEESTRFACLIKYDDANFDLEA